MSCGDGEHLRTARSREPASATRRDWGQTAGVKTVVITGGGRGLGRATAERLAGRGHRVVLVARTITAAQRATREILSASPSAKVEPRALDLASIHAVRTFAEDLAVDFDHVDVLMNIAGVMQTSRTRRTTPDGLEETLAVNTLAPFLLTNLLLPVLERSGSARVVNVSSQLHMPGSRGGSVNFDFDDPQLEHGYDPDRAYKNSKLAVLWFTYELQRRLTGRSITANAICPGFVPATAAASTKGALRWFMAHVMPLMPFATSVSEATDSMEFMAFDPTLEGVGGKYFLNRAEVSSSPESYDAEKAVRFWRLAEELTGFHSN